jgi:hypothetical protein
MAMARKVFTLMTPYDAIGNTARGKTAKDPIASLGGTIIGDRGVIDSNLAFWAGIWAYDANRSVVLGGCIVGNKGVGNGNEGAIYSHSPSPASGMVVNNLAILNSDRGKESTNSSIFAIDDGEAVNHGCLGQGGPDSDNRITLIPINSRATMETPRPANRLVSPLQSDGLGDDKVLGVDPLGNQNGIEIRRLVQCIADGGTGANGIGAVGCIAA